MLEVSDSNCGRRLSFNELIRVVYMNDARKDAKYAKNFYELN